MVTNFNIKCKICQNNIRIRYQVSEENCPINFYCPKCGTHIDGSIKTIPLKILQTTNHFTWSYEFKLNNAEQISDDVKAEYVLEISPDFLVNPITKNYENTIITPFLRHMQNCQNPSSRFFNFLDSWKKNWNDIKINLDLCHNEKFELLAKRLSPESLQNSSIPQNINCIMLTHQQLISFCAKILPKKSLPDYTKMQQAILKLYRNKNNEFNYFFSIYNLNSIKDIERKLFHLIVAFLEKYPNFLPIFNSLYYKQTDPLIVSTLNFEEIKTLYNDSYELLLFILPEIIGLNNIAHRNGLNIFNNGEFDFKTKVDSYSSKYDLYNKLFIKEEKFSWLISNHIENHIRNSIGHFDYEIENIDQAIIFKDKSKNKTKTIKRSLTSIAIDCIYMFYSIINTLELNYILLKMLTIKPV